MPEETHGPAESADVALEEEGDLLDDENASEEDRIPDLFKGPLREDPWRRWPLGQEPIREIPVRSVDGDASPNFLLRWASIEVEPGILPQTRFDQESKDYWHLHFIGRWNAIWTGNRLTELSLDCFREEWPDVLRIVFDPEDPIDLLATYNAASPGMWGLKLVAEDILAKNARDEILGHDVSARDPRLALRIAARYPGVCLHTNYFEFEYQNRTEIKSEKAREIKRELDEAVSASASEPMPGLRAAVGESDPLAGVAAMMGGDTEPPPVPFIEPVAASLDSYSAIGTCALDRLAKATLIKAPAEVVSSLAVHLTFPDAISAIRRADPDRLPIWLDFSGADGEPERRSYPAGLAQPLFGVLIEHEDDKEEGGPFHAVIPVGRNVGLREEAMALCGLAVGADDAWRYPAEEGQITLITAHRGGVAVRHANTRFTTTGITPEITETEIGHEISGYIARTTEWVLARVGAVLGAIEDGLLHLQRLPVGQRSFELVRSSKTPAKKQQGAKLEAAKLVARLRQLGSLRRVAEVEGAEILAVREAFDKAGVDPDQVRRDEVLQRYRRTPSMEGIVGELHMFRDEVERILREAGVDLGGTPIPHDVTDPQILEAIAAYREAGTLEDAGARLGVSGETIRRRLSQAGLTPDQIKTDLRHQVISESVEAWEKAGRSLAGAARELDVDPRTVKAHLAEAGVSISSAADERERVAEAQKLYEIVGSARAVGALLGLSTSTVRRHLGNVEDGGRGRPRISEEALDQAVLAYSEHGSIRAAARATGISPGGFAYRLRLAREREETS
jgi:DNA-binding CsgD family transcriptional regulator